MAPATYGALLDAVRGVRWPARRRVAGAVTGVHQSRARGTTAEFSEFRAYRQGDDPRRLDWKLLAREIAVALTAVAQASGDPVGLIVSGQVGDGARLVPRSRRGVVAEVARLLEQTTPNGAGAITPAITLARTARLAVVTDLLGDADAMLRAATIHIAAGGEVHVVHVIAEAELRPPRGARLVRDPESASDERLFADDTRAEYEQRFAEWRREMARRWRAAGAAYSEAITSEATPRIVRRIAEPQVARGS